MTSFHGTVLAFMGLSGIELIVVGVVLLLLFGARIPKVARGLGLSIKEFKKGIAEGSKADQKIEGGDRDPGAVKDDAHEKVRER